MTRHLLAAAALAACVRASPSGSDADLAAMPELAAQAVRANPNMRYVPALDDVARELAASGSTTPGALAVQELIWSKGLASTFAFVFGGTESELESLGKRKLAYDFGVARTAASSVILTATSEVELTSPLTAATGAVLRLSGRVRDPAGRKSLKLYGPGSLQPQTVPLRDDGTWEPLDLPAPSQPGRYFLELVEEPPFERTLLLMPVVVGTGTRPLGDAASSKKRESVEAQARSLVLDWRRLANAPVPRQDARADAVARAAAEKPAGAFGVLSSDDYSRIGFDRIENWSMESSDEDAWESGLLRLMRPSIGARFTRKADVLAIGAGRLGTGGKLVVDLLERK